MEILTTLLLWLNVASPEPPVRLDDLVAFPSRHTIRAEFGRACDHRCQVWDAITFHTPAHGPGMRHYQDVIAAMEWTYQVWDALDDASNPYWGAEQLAGGVPGQIPRQSQESLSHLGRMPLDAPLGIQVRVVVSDQGGDGLGALGSRGQPSSGGFAIPYQLGQHLLGDPLAGGERDRCRGSGHPKGVPLAALLCLRPDTLLSGPAPFPLSVDPPCHHLFPH